MITGSVLQKQSEKTGSCSALPTTNLTWTNNGSNQGLRGEGPATNRLM